MSLFLGETEYNTYNDKEILVFAAGPGGLVVGCLSHSKESTFVEFSVWITVKNQLILVESLPLCKTILTDERATVQWHPSGNAAYVFYGGQLLLVNIEWGDLYQNNRRISLAEFYSLFLCDPNVETGEDASYGVNLRQMGRIPNLTATSLHISNIDAYCTLCNTSSTGVAEVVAISSDLLKIKTYYLPAASHSSWSVLTAENENIATLSPMQAVDSEVSNANPVKGNYQICSQQNSLGVVLGFSSDNFFILQRQCSLLVASSPIFLAVLKENRSSSVDSEEQSVCDDWDTGNSSEDENDVHVNDKELDMVTHGRDNMCNGSSIICDVLCVEPGLDWKSINTNNAMRLSVFYIFLLKHCNSVNGHTYELVCIQVNNASDNKSRNDNSPFSYLCRIISRRKLMDDSDPISTGFTGRQNCSSLAPSNKYCDRLQWLQCNSNAPNDLLVILQHTVQCISICEPSLREAVDCLFRPSVQNIFESVKFTINVSTITSVSDLLPKLSLTVTSSMLVVTISWGNWCEYSMMNGISVVYSVSVLQTITHSTECNFAEPRVIDSILFDLAKGTVMAFSRSESKLEDVINNADPHDREFHGMSGTEKDVEVFPIRGGKPYDTVFLPHPLRRDITSARCNYKLIRRKQWDSSMIFSAADAQEMDMAKLCGMRSDLLCAMIEKEDSRKYLAYALSTSPALALHCAKDFSSRQDLMLSQRRYVWIQSIVTSKWKILQIPDSPLLNNVILLHFNKPSLISQLQPGKVYTTRKKFLEHSNKMLGTISLGWFEDHSLYMFTIRDSSGVGHHCCLEVMSRSSENCEPITVEHNKYQNGRKDLRRISSPDAHVVVPMPMGFSPVCSDCVAVSKDYSSVHNRELTLSASNSCAEKKEFIANVVKRNFSCLLICGSAAGYFIALQIVGILSPDDIDRFKYGERERKRPLKPISYEVALVWQCDLSMVEMDAFCSSNSCNIMFPVRSAHVIVSAGGAKGNASDDVGIILLDLFGQVIKISVASKMVIGSGDEVSNALLCKQCISAAYIASGACSSVVRISAIDKIPDVEASFSFELFSSTFLLSSVGVDNMIYLALSKTGEGATMDRVMVGPINTVQGALFANTNLIHGFSLSTSSDTRCLPLFQFPPFLSVKEKISYIDDECHNIDWKCGRPTLVLTSHLICLALLLGLLNTSAASLKPITTSEELGSAINLSYVMYHHSAVDIVEQLLRCLKRHSLVLLSFLEDGIESHLKSLIERPNFSRHSPDFAILTTALFAADDMFFIDVFSKIARKLEPHVSEALFPLPNIHTLFLRGNGENDRDFACFLNGDDKSLTDLDKRNRKYIDSCWNQLTLFELCLSRKSLGHASRFLTIACEYLGGVQCIETITASLIIATELLYESLRHVCLTNTVECIDFCVRLDMIASELTHQGELSEQRSPSNSLPISSKIFRMVQHEIVEMAGFLSPILGTDLHDVLEDVIEPQNVRNCLNVGIYGHRLYNHSELKHSFEQIHGNPPFLSVDSGGRNYYAFCAANIEVEKYVKSHRSRGVDSSDSDNGSVDASMLNEASLICPHSYTGTVIKLVVSELVKNQQWFSASVIMSTIQQHALSTCKQNTSWIEDSLFYNNVHTLALGKADALNVKESHIAVLMKLIEIPLSILMCPSHPIDGEKNADIREFLVKEFNVEQLQKMCEDEMFVTGLNPNSHMEDPSLVSMDFDLSLDNISTSNRSCDEQDVKHLFSIPESNMNSMTVVNFLRGTGTAALLTGRVDVLLFISVILCRREIADACLRWEELECRRAVINFFLSRHQDDSYSSNNHREMDQSDNELLGRLFNYRVISLRQINEEILLYYCPK